MSNELYEMVSTETISTAKSLINKSVVSPEDTKYIISILDEYPTTLNHLSLEEVSKLSLLGIDLSRYMSSVHMNNIKVFVVKFASDSMMRVSKLVDILNKVEEKYYLAAMNNQYIHPKVAADMIDKIQESITASVNLMMKLTDNETLMNLFIVNMNNINETIDENKHKGFTSSRDLLPLESRKKIDRAVSLMAKLLEEDSSIDSDNVIDAEVTELDNE
jgi:formylmethanofuran dehydrogenase subunit E-like metal-binding protein